MMVAIISEMIHTASLVHDDILDHAETRRGKVWEKSVGIFWNSGILSPDLTRLSITLALGPFMQTYPTCLALTSLGVDWLQDLIMFLEKQLFCPCFSIKCLRSVGLDLFGVT